MTKKTYVYDKESGSMVLRQSSPEVRSGPYVIDDIKPYRVVGPEYGKLITSRSQHREYLRKHNLIEVGNEKKYMDPNYTRSK